MTFISVIFSDGTIQQTKDRFGSTDEKKYYKVGIACGPLQNEKKNFFLSKESYKHWNEHHREETEKKGAFQRILGVYAESGPVQKKEWVVESEDEEESE
tara:strand:- start:8132 stop:8428 length:297 start_codon:yes stop_codon:yes gene_type:complete